MTSSIVTSYVLQQGDGCIASKVVSLDLACYPESAADA